MVNKKFIILLFFTTFLFLSGCLFKTKTEADCNKEIRKIEGGKNAALASCYYEVAINYALQKNSEKAKETCDKLANEEISGDKVLRISCYKEIARILKNKTICYHIEKIYEESKETMILSLGNTTIKSCVANATARIDKIVCTNAAILLIPFILIFLSAIKK